MRKITVILIALVFICSIMIVNFFGLNYKIYDKNQYVEKIEMVNVTVSSGITLTKNEWTTISGKEYYFVEVLLTKNYIESEGKNPIIMFNARCLPDNANNKNLVAVYNKNKKDYSFEEDTPIPTLIYNSVPLKNEILNFAIKNPLSTKQINVMLYTKLA